MLGRRSNNRDAFLVSKIILNTKRQLSLVSLVSDFVFSYLKGPRTLGKKATTNNYRQSEKPCETARIFTKS